MTLRKPKHDNFSKLGFKIDRLNQTRNHKNIQNIVSCINRQEQEYKLTDFDIFLYHVYSKPLSSCLKQPTQEVNKSSPRSLQEQNIAYQQMNQYLNNLKELRSELQNDHKYSQKARMRRFSTSTDDYNSEIEETYQQNGQNSKGQRLFSSNKLKSLQQTQNRILDSHQKLNQHQSFINYSNIVEKKNQIRDNPTTYAQVNKIAKYRSKTEEQVVYSDDHSDMQSTRQDFSNIDVDRLKQRKQQINQQQLNLFYGTKAAIQKTSAEDKTLKEELEELQLKNQYKLKQIESKNELQNEGLSGSLSIISSNRKKISENINNLQFYDKILPQNASLTKHPQAYNSVIRDAYKRQQQRLRGENTASFDQEFERKIINIIHSPSHKVQRRGGLRDNIFIKQSKDKLMPLHLSTINTTLSPKQQESPNSKQNLKERVSQVLDHFNVRSLEMDYQLKKSRAFINQVEDSDLEDTQTFDKRLYMEKNKIDQSELQKKQSEDNEAESIYCSDEEEEQRKEQNKIIMGTPNRQNQSPLLQIGQRSSSPQKYTLHKIFNKSLCNSLAGSQILNEIKMKKQGLNSIQLEKINLLPSEKDDNRFNILSPTHNKGNSQVMNPGLMRKEIESRRMTTDNVINTPQRIKLVSLSPQHQMFSREQYNFYNDISDETINNKQSLNTLTNLKSSAFATPQILANKLSPLIQYENIPISNNGSRIVSPIHIQAVLKSPNNFSKTPFTMKNRREEVNSELKKNSVQKQEKSFDLANDKESKKSINFEVNFTSQYQQVQMNSYSEKKQVNLYSPQNSSGLRFNSQDRQDRLKNKNQVKQLPNLQYLDSIQSENQQNSSVYSQSAQSNHPQPFIQASQKEEEKINKFIENKKKIYPKLNWKKYKNESSLLNKMDDLTSKAQAIKQQFNQISKKFKEEIDIVVSQNQHEEPSQIIDFKDQNGQILSDKYSILGDKEKITKLIKSIENDSINLQYYIEIQDKLHSDKKKYEEEYEAKNIKAYHLSESPLLKS